MQNLELIKFVNGGTELEVNVSPEENTVWLSRDQMAALFNRDRTVISRHIKSVLTEEELEEKSNVHFLHIPNSDKSVAFFSLDVILLVGYRVKSKNGILFRKWASNILKDYMIKGYVANERRLSALNKTIELQSKIIATAYEIDSNDVKKVVDSYIDALTLLDSYDHQCVPELKKDENYVQLTSSDIRTIIKNMEYYGKSDVFGVEKEKGKIDGILGAVYQNVFGQEFIRQLKKRLRIYSISWLRIIPSLTDAKGLRPLRF